KLSGPTVYVPARRINPETVEIGRTIENNVFTPGVQLTLNAIDVGRQLILRDSAGEPTAAEVTGVAAIGLDVAFNTTPDDLTTALELRLDAEQSQRLTGLRSTALRDSIALTSPERELSVTIGALLPRTIKLSAAPESISAAAAALQVSLTASLPLTPEFAQCRVTHAENTLIVLTEVPGLSITFGPTSADPTTAGELGLVSPGAFRIDALLSGKLTVFPAITNPLRELSVAFGPIGRRGAAPDFATLNDAINDWVAQGRPNAVITILDNRSYSLNSPLDWRIAVSS
ncbi:MAG: hypothetical protein ACREF9_06125, partial [Opitutaceae bacterium]